MIFAEYAKTPESIEILTAAGLIDKPEFLTKIEEFYNNLIEVNKGLNLTRITEPEEFWGKNILDTLLIAQEIPELKTSCLEKYVTVVDIGCGGGIPLIPLAIAYPYCEFHGFESRRKKAFYLLEQIEDLGLKNCNVMPFRAIEASRMEEYCKQADYVTARAVARIEKLAPETIKFLAQKGKMVFYKTPTQLDEEMTSAQEAAKKLKLKITTSQVYELPCELGSRQFAILQAKTRNRNRR